MLDKESLDLKVLVQINIEVKRAFGCSGDNKQIGLWYHKCKNTFTSYTVVL